MKNRFITFALILSTTICIAQTGKDPTFLPPFNFRVDSISLLATWEAPKIVLLNEDFEGEAFPPEGWSDTSLGAGWIQTNDPDFWFWSFPVPDGSFALVNDDLIYNNNGSLDYLITPSLDLTVAESFYLAFDSYFDGGYGQQAFIEYSLDNGNTWQLLHQMIASLEWEDTRIDLSDFSGTEGESNILFSFHADDNGFFASGWVINNVLICSDNIPGVVHYYKIFLDTVLVDDYVNSTSYRFSFEYLTTQTCAVAARYSGGESHPVEQTVHSVCLPKPENLGGFAPDEAVILTWDPPKVMHDGPAVRNIKSTGEIISYFPAPSPIGSCFGICDDGTGLWISDPEFSSSTIFKVTYDGVNTGETITINQGQSWIGDMVSDGNYLYCCLIGGSNRIGKIDLSTGQIVSTIGGAFSSEAQMGLAADFVNEEFYIGGWNSNMIWRTHFNGTTISTHPFNNVSGLAWSPQSGPYGQGSLWVMVKANPNWVTEVLPNNNWSNVQSFMIPGSEPNSGAGIELKTGGYYGLRSLWICNQVENKVYLVDLVDPLFPGPQPLIPDNLSGFNLYKNGEFRDYVEYTAPDSCGYVDPVSWGEWNEGTLLEYEVTAVFDMSPYGYPGETGESLPDGPAVIPLFIYWFELDFLEDWSAGTFNDNAWYITDSNWTISQDIGNAAPCAVFMPGGAMNDYNAALQSFHFLESFEDIILEYDLALSSINPTGNEKLEVQVFDYTNRTWNTLREISNIDGSFNWRRDSMNISGAFNVGEYKTGAFRIRFNATGENSTDISYWAVDNISLTRICPAPDSIEISLMPPTEDSIRVTWEEPLPPLTEWKQWDDGMHYESIGFGTGKETWTGIAARWTPEMLREIKGAVLTKIGFIPCDLRAFFKIAVWTGEDLNPVYLQATGDLVLNEYNVIQLIEPLNIDITKDLYIGYFLSTDTGYPISVDDGPAIDGFGNMALIGNPVEWRTLLEMNDLLDFNWNIKAYFERDGVPVEQYQLYRSLDNNDYDMIAETQEPEYTDFISPNYNSACYKLKSAFDNGCVSDFSEDTCIVLTSVDPGISENEGYLNIYPNPVSNVLYIEAEEVIESVSIFDSRGGSVETGRQGDKETGRIDVGGLAPGLYLVRVELGSGVVGRKFVKNR